MAKAHEVLIGIVFISLVAASFLIFYKGGADEYSTYTTDYDNTTLVVFQQEIDDMQALANNTKTSLQQITSPSNPYDVIGGLFLTGWNVLKTVVGGFDSIFVITTEGTSNLPGMSSNYNNLLTTGLLTALIILLFVGLILRALLFKRDD